MKSLILFSVLAFVIGISLGLYMLDDSSEPASPFSSMDFGGDFILHNGDNDIRLSDYRGKLVLIFFGYTSCPDICPATMATVSAALKKLDDDELAKVQVLFISVDPERDTVDSLNSFTEYFHPNILGVTGSKQEIDQVVKQYGSAYRKVKSDSALGYLVDHSAAVYIVDAEGDLKDMLPVNKPVDDITGAIRTWL
jgi:protein SCO1/2